MKRIAVGVGLLAGCITPGTVLWRETPPVEEMPRGYVPPGRRLDKGCHATSACGCSNKRKNECGGLCCRWTKGVGCDCA